MTNLLKFIKTIVEFDSRLQGYGHILREIEAVGRLQDLGLYTINQKLRIRVGQSSQMPR